MERGAESRGIDRVIELVIRVGNLTTIGPDDDFYDAGFSSIRALELLSELEDAFEVSIPDDNRFPSARTPRALHGIIQELVQ